jgi:hypothetical protein
MPSTAINVRLPNEMLERIDAESDNRSEYCRQSIEQVWDLMQVAGAQHPIGVRTALEYLAALEREGRKFAARTLAPDELALIVDVLNGTLLGPATFGYLWAEVEDSLSDGLADKWGVDGPALVAKLRGLPPCALYALTRAVTRYWASEDRPDPRQVLEAKA